jgi:hypothetical protein
VDGHGQNFVDDIFNGKAEAASQRLRAGMKKWSGAIWYDIKSGIKSSIGSNQVKIEDIDVWIADQQVLLTSHLAVPVSVETNDITVDLTQSNQYKYSASLLKGLDECQDFGDYQANLMDIGKQLWEVSDTMQAPHIIFRSVHPTLNTPTFPHVEYKCKYKFLRREVTNGHCPTAFSPTS